MALAEQGLSAVLLQRRAPPAEPAAGAPWLRRPTCQQPRAVRFVRRRRVMPNAGPLDRSAPQAMTSTTLARAAPHRVGWLALIGGTTIIAPSGVLARFLDVGPLAGAAWRMGLAVPALAAFSKRSLRATRNRSRRPAFRDPAHSRRSRLRRRRRVVSRRADPAPRSPTPPSSATSRRSSPSSAARCSSPSVPRRVFGLRWRCARRLVDHGRHEGADERRFRRRLRAQRCGLLRDLPHDHQAGAQWARRRECDAVAGGGLRDRADDCGADARRDDGPEHDARLDDRRPARRRLARDGARPDLGGGRPRPVSRRSRWRSSPSRRSRCSPGRRSARR